MPLGDEERAAIERGIAGSKTEAAIWKACGDTVKAALKVIRDDQKLAEEKVKAYRERLKASR